MSFVEAKAVLAKNPGAVLTRDSAGNHIVKNKAGQLLYSQTLQSIQKDVGKRSPLKTAEPILKGKKRLLDPFMTALAVGAAELESKSIDPLLEQAIQATSSRPIDELLADPEVAQGAINAAKGKYFELLIERDLEQGYEYEGLALDTYGSVELAKALNQPGWDLQIFDAEGAVVEVLQLKATDSASYLKEALETYPDIRIMATEEVAALEDIEGTVIDSGVSNAEITQDVTAAVHGSDPDFFDAFSPIAPLVFILATEGMSVALGRESEQHFAERLSERAKHAVTGSAVGAAFVALGFGPFAVIPAFLAAREGPEGLLNLAGNLARGETSEESHKRRTEDAKRMNAILESEGLRPKYTAETVPDTSTTGIKRIDDFIRDFRRGWKAAGDPELVEKRRLENQAKIDAHEEYVLRQLDK